MRIAAGVSLGACVTLLLLSACDDPSCACGPHIDSTVVASADVAGAIDASRTYEYDFSEVRTDSVLLALWTNGLPVSQAWLPLNYLCDDVRGPRLTVELGYPDDRMASYDFSLGTGRLQCSQDLRRYRIVP